MLQRPHNRYGDFDMREFRRFNRQSHSALAIALSAAVFASFSANAAPPQAPSTSANQSIDKALLAAMRRDLGLDTEQATRYLGAERSAMARTPAVMKRLGDRYAGSWLEADKKGDFRMVVATTDADGVAQARALGADTRLVKRSLAQLDAAKAELDRAGKQRRRDPRIHSWYVDVRTNQVVVEAEYKAQEAALDFVASTGIDAGAVRFQESQGKPVPVDDIIGGLPYLTPGSGCSIGFPVTRGADTGFATAGHCGTVGTTTSGVNGLLQGVFDGSTFPGTDMGWVRITNIGAWTLRNFVSDYAGGSVAIAGSTQAPVGAAVCRSGQTTGYRCGSITANNVTVNYPQGATFGLTRTSACVGFGDSGGSYITPAGQAQGVTSGGIIPSNASNNCGSSSPVSYHQPILPLLNQYGLSLFTGAGSGVPTITRFNCPDYNNSGGGTYICTVQYTSATPASVVWTGGGGSTIYDDVGYSEINGICKQSQTRQLTATITNSAGSVSRTSVRFACPVGPIP
jgi:S1-C subfamily serine protease